MMKHDTGSTPIPIGEPNATASAAITAGSTSSLKRGLWRHRSVIETPVCARSPITKAFDFLPWGRNKKCVEKTQTLQEHQKQQQQQQQQQQQKQQQAQKFSSTSNTKSTNVAAGSCSNSNVNTNAPADKDVGIHYHRNIFRSGGGLIRDILGGDKLHKDKTSNSNQQELTLKKSSNQRTKPKQVVARNKSLDIHELINTVEHELKAEKSKNGRSQFMDDTFIENIMRAKEAYRREHNELPDQDPVDDDGNYRYVDETVDGECNAVRQTHEMQRASDEQLHCTPSGSAAANTPARHILFNDEDIVYLIKKELPVKREMSKTKRKVSANHGAMSEKERQQQHQQQQQREHERDRARERSRDRHERSESVLRARLKFKKLTPDATPLPDRRSASAQMLNHNQYHNQSEYGISNEYGQPQGRNYQASRSVNDGYGDANNNSGSSKRSILQRQNTSPALISLAAESGTANGNGNVGVGVVSNYEHEMSHHHTPENRRRHHQLFQRGEQRVQLQRRKSFTDYDNAQLGNCSSSSSMASGGGSAGTPTNELPPRGEKPRKKLSFREPVADRPRVRRRSSPQQQSPSDNAINDTAYGLGVASSTPTTKESNNRLGVEDGILIGNANAHKVSCDNLSAGSASHNAALLSLPDNRSYTGQINNLPLDVSGCCYVDNANLAMDFESQAMRIVRTVGQAFEVCHKFNLHKNSLDHNDERSDVSSELLDAERISVQQLTDDEVDKKEPLTAVTDIKPAQRPNHLELVPQTSVNMRKSPSLLTADEDKSPTTPSSPSHEINKLKDQLEQQAIQTRQALAQLMLVREQLISETNARIEAQARTQQLLQQNRELLEHLASLGAYNEQQTAGLTSANIGMAPQLSSTAKVARWFQQLPWHTASLSRPESGFVSGDSRSEKFHCEEFHYTKEPDDLCDEFLLVEGSSTIWTKLSAKKQRKLLGMRLGKVTTF